MRRNTKYTLQLCVAMASVLTAVMGIGVAPSEGSDATAPGGPAAKDGAAELPTTVEEARGRARLLHETIHATLQIVHLQYYRLDEGLVIPARTLKTVFKELSLRQNVQLQWLVVNATAMNVDHNPRDEFEKNAAKAIASGEQEVELFENGVYRHAGGIRLSSECLKCHLPNRTSTEDRAAGLVISMRVKKN